MSLLLTFFTQPCNSAPPLDAEDGAFRDESLQPACPPLLRAVGTPSISDESSKILAPGAPWRPEATRAPSPRRCPSREPTRGGRREAAAPQVRGRRRHRPTGRGLLTGGGRAAPPCPAMDYAGLAEAAAAKIGQYRQDPSGWRGCRSTVSPGRDVRGGIGAGKGTRGWGVGLVPAHSSHPSPQSEVVVSWRPSAEFSGNV